MRFIWILIVLFVSQGATAQLPATTQNYFYYGVALETSRIHNEGVICLFDKVLSEPLDGKPNWQPTLERLIQKESFIDCWMQIDFGVLGNLLGGETIIKGVIPQLLQEGIYDSLISYMYREGLLKTAFSRDTIELKKIIEEERISSHYMILAIEKMRGYEFDDSTVIYRNLNPLIKQCLNDTKGVSGVRRERIFKLVWYRESLLLRTFLREQIKYFQYLNNSQLR